MKLLMASVTIGACLVGLAHGTCAAQDGPRGQHSPLSSEEIPAPAPVQPGERSTLSGVYTAAQAVRGDSLFQATCGSCHAPPNQPIALERVWSDELVSALFTYCSTFTPRDNPASLLPQQYADIIAYIFSINGLPAGDKELPVTDSVLSMIRIETKASDASATGAESAQ